VVDLFPRVDRQHAHDHRDILPRPVGMEKRQPVPKLESICKTVLAHESGDPGVHFGEKSRRSKISWDCPFTSLSTENTVAR
jgi:hypothetical protein